MEAPDGELFAGYNIVLDGFNDATIIDSRTNTADIFFSLSDANNSNQLVSNQPSVPGSTAAAAPPAALSSSSVSQRDENEESHAARVAALAASIHTVGEYEAALRARGATVESMPSPRTSLFIARKGLSCRRVWADGSGIPCVAPRWLPEALAARPASHTQALEELGGWLRRLTRDCAAPLLFGYRFSSTGLPAPERAEVRRRLEAHGAALTPDLSTANDALLVSSEHYERLLKRAQEVPPESLDAGAGGEAKVMFAWQCGVPILPYRGLLGAVDAHPLRHNERPAEPSAGVSAAPMIDFETYASRHAVPRPAGLPLAPPPTATTAPKAGTTTTTTAAPVPVPGHAQMQKGPPPPPGSSATPPRNRQADRTWEHESELLNIRRDSHTTAKASNAVSAPAPQVKTTLGTVEHNKNITTASSAVPRSVLPLLPLHPPQILLSLMGCTVAELAKAKSACALCGFHFSQALLPDITDIVVVGSLLSAWCPDATSVSFFAGLQAGTAEPTAATKEGGRSPRLQQRRRLRSEGSRSKTPPPPLLLKSNATGTVNAGHWEFRDGGALADAVSEVCGFGLERVAPLPWLVHDCVRQHLRLASSSAASQAHRQMPSATDGTVDLTAAVLGDGGDWERLDSYDDEEAAGEVDDGSGNPFWIGPSLRPAELPPLQTGSNRLIPKTNIFADFSTTNTVVDGAGTVVGRAAATSEADGRDKENVAAKGEAVKPAESQRPPPAPPSTGQPQQQRQTVLQMRVQASGVNKDTAAPPSAGTLPSSSSAFLSDSNTNASSSKTEAFKRAQLTPAEREQHDREAARRRIATFCGILAGSRRAEEQASVEDSAAAAAAAVAGSAAYARLFAQTLFCFTEGEYGRVGRAAVRALVTLGGGAYRKDTVEGWRGVLTRGGALSKRGKNGRQAAESLAGNTANSNDPEDAEKQQMVRAAYASFRSAKRPRNGHASGGSTSRPTPPTAPTVLCVIPHASETEDSASGAANSSMSCDLYKYIPRVTTTYLLACLAARQVLQPESFFLFHMPIHVDPLARARRSAGAIAGDTADAQSKGAKNGKKKSSASDPAALSTSNAITTESAVPPPLESRWALAGDTGWRYVKSGCFHGVCVAVLWRLPAEWVEREGLSSENHTFSKSHAVSDESGTCRVCGDSSIDDGVDSRTLVLPKEGAPVALLTTLFVAIKELVLALGGTFVDVFNPECVTHAVVVDVAAITGASGAGLEARHDWPSRDDGDVDNEENHLASGGSDSASETLLWPLTAADELATSVYANSDSVFAVTVGWLRASLEAGYFVEETETGRGGRAPYQHRYEAADVMEMVRASRAVLTKRKLLCLPSPCATPSHEPLAETLDIDGMIPSGDPRRPQEHLHHTTTTPVRSTVPFSSHPASPPLGETHDAKRATLSFVSSLPHSAENSTSIGARMTNNNIAAIATTATYASNSNSCCTPPPRSPSALQPRAAPPLLQLSQNEEAEHTSSHPFSQNDDDDEKTILLPTAQDQTPQQSTRGRASGSSTAAREQRAMPSIMASVPRHGTRNGYGSRSASRPPTTAFATPRQTSLLPPPHARMPSLAGAANVHADAPGTPPRASTAVGSLALPLLGTQTAFSTPVASRSGGSGDAAATVGETSPIAPDASPQVMWRSAMRSSAHRKTLRGSSGSVRRRSTLRAPSVAHAATSADPLHASAQRFAFSVRIEAPEDADENEENITSRLTDEKSESGPNALEKAQKQRRQDDAVIWFGGENRSPIRSSTRDMLAARNATIGRAPGDKVFAADRDGRQNVTAAITNADGEGGSYGSASPNRRSRFESGDSLFVNPEKVLLVRAEDGIDDGEDMQNASPETRDGSEQALSRPSILAARSCHQHSQISQADERDAGATIANAQDDWKTPSRVACPPTVLAGPSPWSCTHRDSTATATGGLDQQAHDKCDDAQALAPSTAAAVGSGDTSDRTDTAFTATERPSGASDTQDDPQSAHPAVATIDNNGSDHCQRHALSDMLALSSDEDIEPFSTATERAQQDRGEIRDGGHTSRVRDTILMYVLSDVPDRDALIAATQAKLFRLHRYLRAAVGESGQTNDDNNTTSTSNSYQAVTTPVLVFVKTCEESNTVVAERLSDRESVLVAVARGCLVLHPTALRLLSRNKLDALLAEAERLASSRSLSGSSREYVVAAAADLRRRAREMLESLFEKHRWGETDSVGGGVGAETEIFYHLLRQCRRQYERRLNVEKRQLTGNSPSDSFHQQVQYHRYSGILNQRVVAVLASGTHINTNRSSNSSGKTKRGGTVSPSSAYGAVEHVAERELHRIVTAGGGWWGGVHTLPSPPHATAAAISEEELLTTLFKTIYAAVRLPASAAASLPPAPSSPVPLIAEESGGETDVIATERHGKHRSAKKSPPPTGSRHAGDGSGSERRRCLFSDVVVQLTDTVLCRRVHISAERDTPDSSHTTPTEMTVREWVRCCLGDRQDRNSPNLPPVLRVKRRAVFERVSRHILGLSSDPNADDAVGNSSSSSSTHHSESVWSATSPADMNAVCDRFTRVVVAECQSVRTSWGGQVALTRCLTHRSANEASTRVADAGDQSGKYNDYKYKCKNKSCSLLLCDTEWTTKFIVSHEHRDNGIKPYEQGTTNKLPLSASSVLAALSLKE